MQKPDDRLRLVSPEIDAFCMAHSSPPSADTHTLEQFTLANVPMSVMLSGGLVGGLLKFMIQAIGAKNVLEVGCYTGYSALWMAEGLPADGKVTTLDIDPDNAKIARDHWARSPHGKKIELIVGDAKATLEELKGPFDLVFIDADKGGYIRYAEMALKRLSPKGILIADNCLFGGSVLEASPKEANGKAMKAFDEWVRSRTDLQSLLLPVRDGLMLIKPKA